MRYRLTEENGYCPCAARELHVLPLADEDTAPCDHVQRRVRLLYLQTLRLEKMRNTLVQRQAFEMQRYQRCKGFVKTL